MVYGIFRIWVKNTTSDKNGAHSASVPFPLVLHGREDGAI